MEEAPQNRRGVFLLMLTGGREEKTSRHKHFQDPNQTPREPPSRTFAGTPTADQGAASLGAQVGSGAPHGRQPGCSGSDSDTQLPHLCNTSGNALPAPRYISPRPPSTDQASTRGPAWAPRWGAGSMSLMGSDLRPNATQAGAEKEGGTSSGCRLLNTE